NASAIRGVTRLCGKIDTPEVPNYELTTMCQPTRCVRSLWAVLALMLSGVAGCSKDATSTSDAAAKRGTPSPFAAHSSRLIEAPAEHVTPSPEMEATTEEAVLSEDTTPPNDGVSITTDADPDSGGAPLTVKFRADVEGEP